MKFFKYINEQYGRSRVEPIEESDAKDSVRYNCKKSVQSSPIYRGTRSFNDRFGLGNPIVDTPRVSSNTVNYYTLIMDNSRPWEPFPDRGQSFICSTSSGGAGGYGKIYRVIPFDGTEIGICSSMDLWVSWKDFSGIEDFVESLKYLADSIDLDTQKMQTNYRYLIQSLDKIGQKMKEYYEKKGELPRMNYSGTDRDIELFFEEFVNTGDRFSEYVIEKLSPKRNGFKLKNAGNRLPDNVEVWFSGKAVFINNDTVNKIILDDYKSIWEWANDINNNKNKEVAIT